MDAGIQKRRQPVLWDPEDSMRLLDLVALVEVSVEDLAEGVVGSEADSEVTVEGIVGSADAVVSDSKAGAAVLVANHL